MKTWPRVQQFHYFARMAPTGYSITVRVDVTDLRLALKAAGLKFFPAYLWLATKCLNRQQEFKIAEKDGVVGFYDTLTPVSRPARGRPHRIHDMDGLAGQLRCFLPGL